MSSMLYMLTVLTIIDKVHVKNYEFTKERERERERERGSEGLRC